MPTARRVVSLSPNLLCRMLAGSVVGVVVLVLFGLLAFAADQHSRSMLDLDERPALLTAVALSVTIGGVVGLLWEIVVQLAKQADQSEPRQGAGDFPGHG